MAVKYRLLSYTNHLFVADLHDIPVFSIRIMEYWSIGVMDLQEIRAFH